MKRHNVPLVTCGAVLLLLVGVLLIGPGTPQRKLSVSPVSPDHLSLPGTVGTDAISAESRSRARLPQNAHNSSDDTEFVRATIGILMARHKASRKAQAKEDLDYCRSFAWDLSHGFIEARLLALCFPKECESLALALLADPKALQDDLVFVVAVLGMLSAQGRKSSENALLGMIPRNDPEITRVALEAITSYDKNGEHRGLYWTLFREEMLEALFNVGPFWVDDQTSRVLLKFADLHKTGVRREFYSGEALDRMGILQSPDRAEKLNALIANIRDPSDVLERRLVRQQWALRAVQLYPTPTALEILQGRLVEGEAEVARRFSRPGVEPVEPENPGYAYAAGDAYYDDVLLTYQSMGGKLNRSQERRLTYYGYLGDPVERLNAFLELQK